MLINRSRPPSLQTGGWLLLLSWLFLAANVALATDCSTICANAGYSGSHCDGTAPFCAGGCNDLSVHEDLFNDPDGYIDCAGKCTDGSSCWTGSKQCSCFDPIDCDHACTDASAPSWNGLWGDDAICAVNVTWSDQNCPGCAIRVIGACGWSGADAAVLLCYCVYKPADLID